MSVFDPELAARMKMPKELLDRAGELHLAMHLGVDFIHASLYDFSASTCLWDVQSVIPAGISIQKFIYQRNWLEGIYRRCTITFDTDRYALVPRSLFDENVVADYLNMQHGFMDGSADYIELPEAEAVLCFEVPNWKTELIQHFPNARLIPLSALLTKVAAMKFQQQQECILVAVSSEAVTFACVRNKSLLLLSTQNSKTPEDVLYHLSNAAMRLEIDLGNCTVELLSHRTDDELSILLKRYIKEVLPIHQLDKANCSMFTQLHYLCA
jgi:hypothetical protein